MFLLIIHFIHYSFHGGSNLTQHCQYSDQSVEFPSTNKPSEIIMYDYRISSSLFSHCLVRFVNFDKMSTNKSAPILLKNCCYVYDQNLSDTFEFMRKIVPSSIACHYFCSLYISDTMNRDICILHSMYWTWWLMLIGLRASGNIA